MSNGSISIQIDRIFPINMQYNTGGVEVKDKLTGKSPFMAKRPDDNTDRPRGDADASFVKTSF